MAEEAVRQLEQASQIVLAPPNVVTAGQRQTAESVFLTFHKSSMPYELCRHILETCKNEYVLFHAACTIKQAVVREWSLLQPSDVESLRSYLLHYVTQNISLQNYVREQILQAVAVIFKRGTVDERSTNREALFSDVTQLIASGSHSMQLVACSILTALLNEYSSTTRSSSVGLPWEIHCGCKIKFEQTDLKKVFMFCLQVLQEFEKLPSPLEREVTAVFNRFLAITEQVLCWEFLPKHIGLKRFVGSFLGNQNVSFKPPSSWKDVILDKGLVPMMIRIHQKVRYNSEMAHHSLMCLSQLASINGQIFTESGASKEFLGYYLQAFLHMLASTQLQDYEALGISNIISNLVMFFRTSVFTDQPHDMLLGFLQHVAKLTCNFCQAAAQEDAMHKDDTLFLEAYEKILLSWTSFLTDHKDLPENIIQTHAVEIFNKYVQCHLSPPDGTRSQTTDGTLADTEEEYEETEEDDREKYKDQLCSIGLFGRHIPQHSIPMLSKLLEDRIGRLRGQLQRIQQCQTLSPGGTGSIETDSSILNTLNEDLHWLILIAANVLTDENEGETPMIPADLMQYSIDQVKNTDLGTTLRVLASPGNNLGDIPGGEQATDPIVRLLSSIFRLCEVEKRAIDAALCVHLSPEVAGTTMWFLARWVPAYLLPNENYYAQLSTSLNTAFGRDTDGSQWTVSYLLDKILSNLVTWVSEPQLIEDTLELFLSMVEKKDRCDYVVKCDTLWKLVKNFSANHQQFDILPATCKRLLCKGLVMAGSSALKRESKEDCWNMNVRVNTSHSCDGEVRLSFTADGLPDSKPPLPDILASALTPELSSDPGARMLWEVLHSLHQHYKSIIYQPNFSKSHSDPNTRQRVISILECLCGVAEASRGDNIAILFKFLHPALEDSVTVLDIFHLYEEVVQLVLELFDSVVNRQICYLSDSDTKKLYKVCLSMIQTFAKYNSGRHHLSKEAEEDQCQDLVTLMSLLTNTLSKSFIDFGEKDVEGTESVDAADVVLYGLRFVVPLMTRELLKFPDLCTTYMRLLTYIAEIYPEKICELPEPLLKTVLASEEMGLTVYGSDIVKLSLEFLTSVAAYVHEKKLLGSMVHNSMAHFLEVIFKMLLLENFDMELLETASTTYFTLMCCHQDRYENLVSALLAKQRDAAVQQRLVDAFSTVTDGLQLKLDRQNKIKFRMNFDHFLMNVRGLLCIK